MRIAGRCRRCGDEVLTGDFCYRIGDDYWCRDCVSRAAVIAAEEKRPPALRILGERRIGQYREREITVWRSQGKEGENTLCRRNR